MLHVCFFQPYLRNFSLWTASWQSFTSECSLFITPLAGFQSLKFISESDPWEKCVCAYLYVYSLSLPNLLHRRPLWAV